MVFWLNYKKWEFFYSVDIDDKILPSFESQFYSYFSNFQIDVDTKSYLDYDIDKSIVWEVYLRNKYFFPFKMDTSDNSDFVFLLILLHYKLKV